MSYVPFDFEAEASRATDETWMKLHQASLEFRSLFVYVVPSKGETPGRFVPILDGDPEPEGAELLTAERVSVAHTRASLYNWLYPLMRRAPVLPVKKD